jgi:hypothetical protein
LVTVIDTVPAVAIADAGIVAISWPLVTRLVDVAVPFQFTTAAAAKLVPFTVSMN